MKQIKQWYRTFVGDFFPGLNFRQCAFHQTVLARCLRQDKIIFLEAWPTCGEAYDHKQREDDKHLEEMVPIKIKRPKNFDNAQSHGLRLICKSVDLRSTVIGKGEKLRRMGKLRIGDGKVDDRPMKSQNDIWKWRK